MAQQKRAVVTSIEKIGEGPRKIAIGKIGRSKLASKEEIQQAREGVGGLAPELLSRYQRIAEVLSDSEMLDWSAEALHEEFGAIAEAVLGTGSFDASASATARRAREVVVLAAGQAMAVFPRTTVALTYLANHALCIGLLREPKSGERGFFVDLPTGDLARPYWKSLLCPFSGSASLVSTYIAMVDAARAKDGADYHAKLNEFQGAVGDLLGVMAAGEGEVICYVPPDDRNKALYLKLRFDNGYITLIDAVGNSWVESLVSFWIPFRSLDGSHFPRAIVKDLDQRQIGAMAGLRRLIRNAKVYAEAKARNQSKPIPATDNALGVAE